MAAAKSIGPPVQQVAVDPVAVTAQPRAHIGSGATP